MASRRYRRSHGQHIHFRDGISRAALNNLKGDKLKTQTMRRIRTSDLRLDAIGPGPQNISPTTWEGDLAPVVRDLITAASPALTAGPKLGQPYSAEDGPVTP